MDSRPDSQDERFDDDNDENGEDRGFGPPGDDDDDDTMSFTAFTDRLPRPRPSGVGSPIASQLAGAPTTTTQDEEVESTTTAATGLATEDGEGNGDASTFTTPIRVSPTTVELSTRSQTSAFSTPNRTSMISQATATSQSSTGAAAASTPSTLSTRTSAGLSDASSSSTAGQDATSAPAAFSPSNADGTALPEIAAASQHGMSDGEIAAAVVMPILAAIAILAALFFCRRRRRKRDSPPPPFFPTIKEKMSQFLPRATSPSVISDPTTPVTPAPVLTSRANNAYYTGLDTPSTRPSGASQEYYAPRSSDDPPPPYAAKNEPQTSAPPQLPPLAVTADGPFEDPADPVSPLHEHERGLEPAVAPAAVSRAPSFSSTQYSDTASVHSARAARMSIGATQQVVTAGSPPRRMGSRDTDVFQDPASPVSSLGSVGGSVGRGG